MFDFQMVASSSLGIWGMTLGARSLHLFRKLNSPSAEVSEKSGKEKDDHKQTVPCMNMTQELRLTAHPLLTSFCLKTVLRVYRLHVMRQTPLSPNLVLGKQIVVPSNSPLDLPIVNRKGLSRLLSQRQ